MSDSIARASARSRRIRQVSTVVAAAVVSFAVVGALWARSRGDDPTSRRVYGPAQALGNGTARTYVTLDAANRPTSLGVALSESAMSGLPQTPMHGMPSAAMLMLALPAQASVTGFDHVMLDWNPQGHEPEHVYTLPHFDFHFYTISEAEQREIMPDNPTWAEKTARLPSSEYVPAGFVSAHTLMGVAPPAASVPMMGLHWLERSAPELNGNTFGRTFIYGSWDGRFIFLEPMITKAHIESVRSAPGGTVESPIGVPAKYGKPGYYPSKYSITWDAAAKEYRVSLDALTKR